MNTKQAQFDKMEDKIAAMAREQRDGIMAGTRKEERVILVDGIEQRVMVTICPEVDVQGMPDYSWQTRFNVGLARNRATMKRERRNHLKDKDCNNPARRSSKGVE